MAVAFVDGVILRRDRWIHIPVKLLDVRHVSIAHCFSQTINYTAQSNTINAYPRIHPAGSPSIIDKYMSR
jgi:hypothetical protein